MRFLTWFLLISDFWTLAGAVVFDWLVGDDEDE